MSESRDIISDYVKARADMHRLDVLGGSESVYGRECIFSQILHEEHEKDGLTDNGMYCFKGLNWYGNIISWEPTLRAIAVFLAHGYTRIELEELRDLWKGINQTIDTMCLSSFLNSAMKREDVKLLLAEADEKRAKLVAAEEARLAAIPHVSPPEDALPYSHVECMEDFAGNHSQPGAWADLYINESGQELVTFGGCWGHYIEEDVLERFMNGERGCPVEARPAKVKKLKKIVADADGSWGGLIEFLTKSHAGLRFGEEFKWEKKD